MINNDTHDIIYKKSRTNNSAFLMLYVLGILNYKVLSSNLEKYFLTSFVLSFK